MPRLHVIEERAVRAGVLDQLRTDRVVRLPSSGGLAGGLRAWLEDAAFTATSLRGESSPPLVLGARQLLGPAAAVTDAAPTPAGGDTGAGAGEPTELPHEVIVSRLAHALFRQIVTVGTIDDPLRDAADALRVDGRRAEVVVRQLERMSAPQRRALAAELTVHATNLLDLVARPAPEWLPRTDDHIAIPLAGGRIVLHGAFDLLVDLDGSGDGCGGVGGRRARGAVTLLTDGAWGRARRSLHYLALLETLRNGTPPLRLALVDSSSGRSGAEDVREEHLRTMTTHVCAWLAGSPWGMAPSHV